MLIPKTFIILLLGFSTFSLLQIVFGSTAQTGSIVPLYMPPGTAWDTLVQVKIAHPSVPILAIINPSNGSGQAQAPAYVIGVQNLQSNGVFVLGYVHTNYAARNSTEINTEITNYKNWYNVNGMFFDQMSNVSGNENYYTNLTAYAKSLDLTFTVGNPGTDTLPSYIGTVDNIVIYDNASLPTIQYLDGWHTNFAKNNFSILSYEVDSLDQSFVNNASNYVGYMYFANDTLPNPWDSIPSYFGNLIAMLDPPNPPTGLTATAVSSSQINLNWTAPTDNGGSAITGYKIERSTDGGSTWSTIVATTGNNATTYADTGLAHSATYTYRVSAINPIGASSPSNTASATTFNTVPSSPFDLTATAASSSQINLSWTAPTDDGGSMITGYAIDRSTDGGSTWTIIVSNTGSTATTYSDTGLTASTTYTYSVSAINTIGTSSPSNTASATTFMNQVKSGLIASDPLNNETKTQEQLQANQQYWRYGGSAAVVGAPYAIFKDVQGLHIGVQAPSNGTWAGYYAVTPNTNASLFHAVITTPVRTIPYQNDYYENGLYVMASQPSVNYVTCVAVTSVYGTVWAVISVNGTATTGTQFNLLWYDTTPNQPLTRDCTIITNGNNYLKVYLDNVRVYEYDKLNLQMPAPFNVFLESESSYPGQLLNGTYKDYYATSDENIQVINLPNNATRVDVVDTSGNVLATAPVSSGTAILNVGKYHFPLAAVIKVYDSSNVLITYGPAIIHGGDVYSASQ